MTDYRTMSGADFQREVGTDPDKWAEAAMYEIARVDFALGNKKRVAVLARWFADAMEAARKDSIREVLKREGE